MVVVHTRGIPGNAVVLSLRQYRTNSPAKLDRPFLYKLIQPALRRLRKSAFEAPLSCSIVLERRASFSQFIKHIVRLSENRIAWVVFTQVINSFSIWPSMDMGMMLRSQKGSFLANRRTRLKPHRLFPSAIVRGSIHHRRRPDTADSMRGRL